MNLDINTTKVTQTGNEVLGTTEKNLYYLIIKNSYNEKLIVNVGQKTHDEVIRLIEREKTLEDIQKEVDNNEPARTLSSKKK